MEIVGGRQVADITLMQMFPWFGTKQRRRRLPTWQIAENFVTNETSFSLRYTLISIGWGNQQQLNNNIDNKSYSLNWNS